MFVKDNSVFLRQFENFFILLLPLIYISYQEMKINGNIYVKPDAQCQTCLNGAMAGKGT